MKLKFDMLTPSRKNDPNIVTRDYNVLARIFEEADMDFPINLDDVYNLARSSTMVEFIASMIEYVVNVPEEKQDEYLAKVRGLCGCLYPMRCPEEGSFTAWKIGSTSLMGPVNCVGVKGEYEFNLCLIELEVPEDAKRSSCYGNKCRCDKALVKSITRLACIISDTIPRFRIEEIASDKLSVAYTGIYNDRKEAYVVGKMVEADGFNENRWRECSNGIHFYMEKTEALKFAWQHFAPFFEPYYKIL